MTLKLATGPAEEPVTVLELKDQLRVDIADEDDYLADLIKTVRTDVENLTRRALITQTWDLYMDGFPGLDYFEVPLPPLQSITSIKYYDTSDVEYTMSASDYYVDIASEPGRVYLKYAKTWPTTSLRARNGVIVRFVAGYGLAASVPEPIKQAMKLLAGHFYENREAVVLGQGFTPVLVPKAADDLLWPYRIDIY